MEERKETSQEKEKKASAGGPQARYEWVLMKEAFEAREKGRYSESVDIFEELLKRFRGTLPDDEKIVINSELGLLYYWLGDYASAKRGCEAALQFGDNDQVYNVLGKIAVAEFEFPRARGYFSKISNDNPARSLGLCLVSIKLRDNTGAEIFLHEANGKINPLDPELRVYHSYVVLLKGDAKAAVMQARELIKKCERDPALILLIAEILMTAGHYGEAKATAQKVGMKCPENDAVFAVNAHAQYAEENWDGSRKSAEHAVELNPRNAYAKTVLMKLACRNGSYSVAESIGLQILSDTPEYSLAHANLGDVYFNEGRYELAQLEYEQTQQLMNSDTKGARLRQARMKFIRGDFKDAAEILEKLIEGYHTYYDDAMCDLALCCDNLGDEERKKEVLDKMAFRRSFYHRTEKILQAFRES